MSAGAPPPRPGGGFRGVRPRRSGRVRPPASSAEPPVPRRGAGRSIEPCYPAIVDSSLAWVPDAAASSLPTSAESVEDLPAGLDRLGRDQDEGDDARPGAVVDPVVHGAALDPDVAGLDLRHAAGLKL